MARRIVDLSILTLTASDLALLPERLAAFFAGTSLAINDMQMLRRSQLLTMNTVKQVQKESSAELLALLQSLTEDRLLSARLYEYCKFYEKFASNCEFGGNVGAAISTALTELSSLKEGQGFEVAKWMRNKLTNHLDIEEAVKIVRQVGKDETFSVLLHETQWNTWHPLGDQILSYYGLQKFGDHGGSLAAWHGWIDRAHDWALQTHNDFIIAMLGEHLPDKVAFVQQEFVDEKLVGTPSTASVPIFFMD